jgi:hypothetical protein
MATYNPFWQFDTPYAETEMSSTACLHFRICIEIKPTFENTIDRAKNWLSKWK